MEREYLLFALLLASITVLALVWRFRKSLEPSISLNATKHPFALLWLGVGVGLSLVLACIWYFGWLTQVYSVNLVSSLVFIGIIVSFFVAIIAPDTKGVLRKVHRAAGYIAVMLMPIFLISVFSLLDPVSQIVAASCIAAQAMMIYLLFFVKKALEYLLQYQALYFLTFFTVLLLLTYAR